MPAGTVITRENLCDSQTWRARSIAAPPLLPAMQVASQTQERDDYLKFALPTGLGGEPLGEPNIQPSGLNIYSERNSYGFGQLTKPCMMDWIASRRATLKVRKDVGGGLGVEYAAFPGCAPIHG